MLVFEPPIHLNHDTKKQRNIHHVESKIDVQGFEKQLILFLSSAQI